MEKKLYIIGGCNGAGKTTAKRVAEGGHNIPKDVIIRRYHLGITNLFNLFMPVVDQWLLYDNTELEQDLIAEFYNNQATIHKNEIYERIKQYTETAF